MPKIWAHRGASAYAPENTLEAFSLAVTMGADGVELDAHLTKDGVAVVCHDEKIDRTSNGTGLICDYTLAELKAFDFGARFPAYRGVRIPTLRQVFELLAPTGLTVNVELKTDHNPYPGIERVCAEIAEQTGMTARVLYSSFNHASLRRIHELDASLPTGLLYGQSPEDTPSYALAEAAFAIHPYYPLMYEGDVMRRVKDAGVRVHPWTVDEPEQMLRLAEMGADALITNVPDVAIRTVRS